MTANNRLNDEWDHDYAVFTDKLIAGHYTKVTTEYCTAKCSP